MEASGFSVNMTTSILISFLISISSDRSSVGHDKKISKKSYIHVKSYFCSNRVVEQ